MAGHAALRGAESEGLNAHATLDSLAEDYRAIGEAAGIVR